MVIPMLKGPSTIHIKSDIYKPILGLGLTYALFAVVITALPGTAFSVWAINDVRVSTAVVGLAFTVNTVVIILGQFFTVRWSRGHRRTRLTMMSTICYATGCILIYIAHYGGVHLVVLTELYGAFTLFGIGDTLLFPMIPALVNDLAPEKHRGRYNSSINFCWQAGSMVVLHRSQVSCSR